MRRSSWQECHFLTISSDCSAAKVLCPSAETRIQWAKFSGSIRCRNLLQILPIVLKLRSTEPVPRGQTRIIFETIEREGKASERLPPWEGSFCNTSFAVGHCFDACTLSCFEMSSNHPEDQIHLGWNEEKQVEPLQSFHISHHLWLCWDQILK